MAGCLFCRIASGELKSYKIYEDRYHVAFLDLFPNIKGQTLVIPKRHMSSNIFDNNDRDISALMSATKKVALLLEARLKVGRVHLVFEGTGVDHAHAKLYPAIGMKGKKFKEVWAKDKLYFKRYEGYVSTLTGPKASESSLMALQKRITGR